MRQSQLYFRKSLISVLGLAAALWAVGHWWMAQAISVDDMNQPASEGRPITPAGTLIVDARTKWPAVGALPVDFVRSPDRTGPDGKGRYLVAVNSGFGVQFSAAGNRGQQSLSVIDLNAKPSPVVIQNVYFPSPQSANVGAVFSPQADQGGAFNLYVAGGIENKIWIFRFSPGTQNPVTPESPGPETKVEAPFIDVNGLATQAATPRYNGGHAAVYPTGLAISPDGDTLFVANNLGDSLGIIRNLHSGRDQVRVDLRGENPSQFAYPYGAAVLPSANGRSAAKVYVSCWNDSAIAVVDPNSTKVTRIPVDRHPTAMIFNAAHTRLFVANSNADSVSVIDTAADREIERINVRLTEKALIGSSPEGLALSPDEKTLFVANAHSNAVAVVTLSQASRNELSKHPSKLRGFIPTGQYPSAIACVGQTLIIGNGKGTGFENSSMIVNNSGRAPNTPNAKFPAGRGQGGQYSVSLISGNMSLVDSPDDRRLLEFTQQVLRNNGLIGEIRSRLFKGTSPIKHVIYIIKENRTYDQLLGDLAKAGDGSPADGDASLAIFGGGETAKSRSGKNQNITPNHHALASRFGLLDRFFVNAEASADGHNWSTAAFSTDYVDKAFRWNYSRRGREYDFEGFNRLPSFEASGSAPPLFHLPATAEDVANFAKQYAPDLRGARDVSEPETLYLWDAARRAGLSYRNYGEFVATLSENELKAINANRGRTYPDLSPTVNAFPTKRSLEGHFSPTFRNFDLATPDSMTTDSYRAAKEGTGVDPFINRGNADSRFRGDSRLGEWLDEFRGYAADVEAGKPDRLPNLSIMRFSNDHTDGLKEGRPTPQFYLADNDYAVGKLVEEISRSPYWKDTAIFVVEDDSQNGPDHVDMHRSPALIISAYNRPGALIHEFHNTVSLIRTMEILLGMPPMNQLDASAAPIDIFRDQADLQPYRALLPEVALDNLITERARNSRTAYWMKQTSEQDMSRPDQADAEALNEIIWYSVLGDRLPMPRIARLPAFDLMVVGMRERREDSDSDEDDDVRDRKEYRYRIARVDRRR